MADSCGFSFKLVSNYFKLPSILATLKSVNSDLPNGKAWVAKYIVTTTIYALVYACSGVFNRVHEVFSYLAIEFNLYTSDDYLSDWEKSVKLPDTRIYKQPTTICERRQAIFNRQRKTIKIVTLQEIQNNIDIAFEGLGIWVGSERPGGHFRYDFRYDYDPFGGSRDRFVLDVHIPWIAIDLLNPVNNKITWENLQNWFRDFVPANVLLNPIYHEQDSYCFITNPRTDSTVYTVSDGIGGWTEIDVHWIEIDRDGTVINHLDTETILPSTVEITRYFTDSTALLIEDTNEILVTILMENI